jgi:hypothetical protein
MRYTVDWSDDATDSLAAIWLQATDRRAVTAAESRIDRLLASDPQANGVHLSEGLWEIVDPPLIARYEIDPASRTVKVTQVGMLP